MPSPIDAIRGPLGRTLTRYAVGSVIAMIVSEITLLLVFGLHVGGARTASAAAWATGAIVNYFLNRNWAWRRRGRAPAKELLSYWSTAIAGLLLSMWATHEATALAPRLSSDHTVATLLVGAAYLITYAVLFVAKFLLFHYVIFTDQRTRSSAEQLPEPVEARETRAGTA